MARWAAFIQRHQDPDANWLTVDAGNFVDRAGTKGGCSNKCQFIINSYSDLHYDVLNIAKSEVGMGYETLVAMRDTAKTSHFISANLIDAKTDKPLFDPYVIKDYGNMRIGILGLLRYEDFPAGSSIIDSTVLRVEPQLDAARKYVPNLVSKADGIIVLCELPNDEIKKLQEAFPDIDLVITSGAVASGEAMTMIGKTRVIGTGSQGYSGHYAVLEFSPAWSDSIGYSDFRTELTDAYDQPGEWADRLAAFEKNPGTSVKPAAGTNVKPLTPTPMEQNKKSPTSG